MKKIAFCFLIYDIINQEELWNIFFKNVDKNKYNIYIHYKNNVPLKYFEEYKLSDCIETKYADVSLIYAHNLLFRKAYDDGCYKMINLSQSCVPFKSFDYVYNFLTKDDFCYFNIQSNSTCFPRCNSLLKYYKKDSIQKSSEWFILNRKVCESVINYDQQMINKEYKSIYAPEEHYFITRVFDNNLQNQIIATPNLSNDATTFTNWDNMAYKFVSKKGLKNYSGIGNIEILYLMNSKCLFGRKFDVKCTSLLACNEYIEFITSKNTLLV